MKEAFRSPWDPPETTVLPMQSLANPHGCTRQHVPRRSLDFQYTTMPAEIVDPSDHHVLVLQTAPRPQPSLEDALTSLESAGLSRWTGSKILSCDGLLDKTTAEKDEWHVFQTTRQQGCARAFARTLRIALAVDPDLERLTFLEDDVELCYNSLSYMSNIAVPDDVAFLTWFTYDYDWSDPRHEIMQPAPALVAHREQRGILACRSTRFFILTQACTFPRRTVELLLSCPELSRYWPRRDGHDQMISWALGDASHAAHFPILVQHTGGLNSAVRLDRNAVDNQLDPHLRGPKITTQDGERRSPHYVGRDFDALSLLPNMKRAR